MNFEISDYINKCSSVYETDDSKYKICIILHSDGNECVLKQQNIYSLNIIDDFHNAFHNGVLDVLNNNDILESSNEPSLKLLASGFKLINNGRDFVIIYISPYNENVSDDNSNNLCFIFTVTSSEDVFIDDNKIKRLYLKDYNEEILSEYKSGFSTSEYAYKLSQYNKNALKNNSDKIFDFNKFNKYIKIEDVNKLSLSQLTNEERSLSTGLCIALLLSKKFANIRIDVSSWDFGGPKIFYSESSNESYLDVLYKLINLHNAQSEDKDKCYLNYEFDISTNEFVWTFYSISYNFKLSNDRFLLETFQLSLNNTDLNNDNSKTINQSLPISIGSLGNTGIINKFFFSDFSSEMNLQYIKSKFLYNYNYINKEFLIDCESSNFNNILNSFDNNYIFNNEKIANTPYNELQLNNENIEHIINLYNEDTNISIGRNVTLNNLLLLNNTIQITIIGDIKRKPGYFFCLSKENANKDNQFFTKLLGEYLILNVHHIFANKRYTNTIIASKPIYNTKPIITSNYTLENE